MVKQSGWMETMEELAQSNIHLLIIPTILIPLTIIGVGISVVATFVAGLFGIKLKSEGPKRLLELLLKPKFLLSALIFNGIIWGGIVAYQYVDDMPVFLTNIHKRNPGISSNLDNYTNVPERPNRFKSEKIASSFGSFVPANSVKLEGGIFRAPAISGTSLFVGTTKGWVYELERESLKELRKFYVGTFVTPAPLIWNNHMVVGEGVHATHHARMYFYSLKTGKLAKHFETKGHTEGQATFASFENQERLFVVAGGDGVYSIDPNTMEEKWHNVDGHVDGSVIVENDRVYVGTGREKGDSKKHRSYAVAYDFITGKTIWKRELPASVWMKPTIADNHVCFVYGEVYFKSEIGGLQCFDKEKGVPTISHRMLASSVSIPLALNDSVVFTDATGNVCSLNTKSRQLDWCTQTHNPKTQLNYVPISYDPYRNILVYNSMKNGLYAIHPKTGKIEGHWLPKEEKWQRSFASALVAPEGWYISDMKGHLRLIRPGKTLLGSKIKN